MLASLVTSWCKQHGLPPPQPEYPFALSIGRGWRFDLGWPQPEILLAVEMEGVTHQGGRHQRVAGMSEDCLKYAEALVMGWRVLRLTPKQINKGLLLVYLERLFGVVK